MAQAFSFFPWLKKIKTVEGGDGSGNFDHAGRPGEIGGSGEGGGLISDTKDKLDKIEKDFKSGNPHIIKMSPEQLDAPGIAGYQARQMHDTEISPDIQARSEIENLQKRLFGKKGPQSQEELSAYNSVCQSKSRLFGEPDESLKTFYKAGPSSKIDMGSIVKHASYGKGTITATSGFGKNKSVTIKFENGKEQKFSLQHAPIEPIESEIINSCKFHEVSALPKSIPSENKQVIDVLLITEGLGNKVNMNYYGPEALASGPAIFEGAPMFFNHASRFDIANLPERDVKDKCGYYRNVRVETIDGVKALRCESHFEQSETGKLAFDKACEAIKYRQENPNSDTEYLGISINADGESEKREVNINGVMTEVNYVTKFIKAIGTSADMVTMPARGGKFLALLESMAGRKENNQEDGMKKVINTIVSALSEARKKHKSIEAAKADLDQVAAMLKEAEEKCEDGEGAGELMPPAEDEGEDMSALKANYGSLKKEHEALLKKHEGIGGLLKQLHDKFHGKGDDAPAGEPDGDEPPAAEPKPEAEESERSIKLVSFMLKEAGIPDGLVDVKELSRKSIKAIEAAISREKKRLELPTGTQTKSKEAAGNVVKLSTESCRAGRE
jgi:hypothetical protein